MNNTNARVALRDSGIPGLGEIPAHWRVIALKHLVGMPITDGPHETPEFVDSGVPFVSAEAVWGGRVHIEGMRGFISRDAHNLYSKKYRPRKNDIYVVKSGATTGKVAIVDSEDEFGIWSPLAAIRCDQEKALPQFVLYSLISDYFQGQVQTSWSLGTQPNIGMEALENLHVFLPPLSEQRAIADYLNREATRLDALVAAKERVLGLLAEKRRALITRAVTRGLDPCAPRHDSGIPWLGEIPAHWEVVPFRWYLRIASGDFIPTDQVVASADDLHRVQVIGGNGLAAFSSSANVEGINLAIGRVGALCGNVHLVIGSAWVTDNALVLSGIRKFEAEYLAELLRTLNLNSIANKTAQPLITGSMVLDLRGPLPPSSEQRAIVGHIARDTIKLDALHAATERTIALLKERRAALIAAAVTGKIDVGTATA